jgi:transposase-like protein
MISDVTVPQFTPEQAEFFLGVLRRSENLQEFACEMMSTIINASLSHEAQAQCGAPYGLQSGDWVNSRNGYRDRSIKTSCGTVDVRIPKLRKGTFDASETLERYTRVDKAVVCMVAELYVAGVSTRAVDRIVRQFGIDGMSKSSVSDLCRELDARVADFKTRPIGESPFLWIDATPLSCQVDGRYRNVMMVTAIGLNARGRKEFLDAQVVDTESYDSWSAFLAGLKERGLAGVRLVISDAHAGLVKAVRRHFCGGCMWQRCWFHFLRNVSQACGASAWKRKFAVEIVRAAVMQETELDAHAVWREGAAALAGHCPKAAELMEGAENDVLAHMAFPRAVWSGLRTNNAQERMNREIKRRTNKIAAFPSEDAMMRLVVSVLLQCNERWEHSNRTWSEGIVRECLEGPLPREDADEARLEACALHARSVVAKVVDEWGHAD